MDNIQNLTALRIFSRIAQTKSFAQTARDMGLPTSSVSRHIAKLEQTLGQRLIYRHTRALQLTDAGERYYQSIRPALEQIQIATEELTQHGLYPSGMLRVNAPVAFGRHHVVPLLAEFQQEYPQVQIDLSLTDEFIDPVREGADIVIRVGALNDSSLVARQLLTQQFMLCAAPSYLQAHGTPSHPEQLSSHNCLLYKGTKGIQPWFFRPVHSQNPLRMQSVQGSFTSNNAESLVSLACMGYGIILFPTWLIFDAVRSGQLQPILTDYVSGDGHSEQGIHVISPENRLRSSKVSEFTRLLFKRLQPAEYWQRLLSPG